MRRYVPFILVILSLGLGSVLARAEPATTRVYLPLVGSNDNQPTFTPTSAPTPTTGPTPTPTGLPNCDITTGFPNLQGRALSGCNLTGANLSAADLSYANLSQSNLTGANLRMASLVNTPLEQANLTTADLTGANLSGADLFQATLQGANLTGAKLINANLTSVTGGTTATTAGVIWKNTTCPDSTNSSQDHGTCKGHGF